MCITRRGEALNLMDEGPTYSVFPVVYCSRGRVREEMKTTNFADSYREDRSKSAANPKEDPLVPGCPQARRELTRLRGRRPRT